MKLCNRLSNMLNIHQAVFVELIRLLIPLHYKVKAILGCKDGKLVAALLAAVVFGLTVCIVELVFIFQTELASEQLAEVS